MLEAGGVYASTETEVVVAKDDVVDDSWNSAAEGVDEVDVVDICGVVVLCSTDVASPSTQMVVVMERVSVTISQVVVHSTARFSWCL